MKRSARLFGNATKRVFFGALSLLFFVTQFSAMGLVRTFALPNYPEPVAVDGDGHGSTGLSISSDGRYVLFSGSDSKTFYVRDRQLGQTTEIRKPSNQTFQFQPIYPRMSDDGSKFYFGSQRREFSAAATRPSEYDLYSIDIATGTLKDITDILGTRTYNTTSSTNGLFFQYNYISNDGRYVAYTTNNSGPCGNALCSDSSVYLIDTQLNTVSPVALYPNTFILGQPQHPIDGRTALSISGDGNYVFYADSLWLPIDQGAKVWRYNVTTGTSQLVGDWNAYRYDVSDDGKHLAFLGNPNTFEAVPPTAQCSDPTNTNPQCFYAYREDIDTGLIEKVSLDSAGNVPGEYNTDGSSWVSISGDGNIIAWSTRSIMRSTKTQHYTYQAYSHNMQTGATRLISINSQLVPAQGGMVAPQIDTTYDGAEAVISVASANFGGPLNCNLPPSEEGGPPGAATACRDAYVVATNPAEIVDIAAPIITSAGWVQDPLPVGANSAKFIIHMSDNASGPAGGEYFFGTDPGLGDAQDLQYDYINGVFYFEVTDPAIVTNLGSYVFHYRVYDNVGNWGSTSDATLTVSDAPQTFSLSPAADTYVRGGQSNRNQGGSQFMQVQSSGSNRALVKFDQSVIQSMVGGNAVLSAKLRLVITDNGNNWGTSGRTVDIHRLLTDWEEGNGTENDRGTGSGTTWSCAVDGDINNQAKDCSGSTEWEMGQPSNPAVHPWQETPTDTQTITNGQTGVFEYDVTADVVAFLNGAAGNYGWIIKKTNEGQNGQASFGSRESLSSEPQLVITYQP